MGLPTFIEEMLEQALCFNIAFLTCIGKKPLFCEEDTTPVYEPKATRPLSIVNSDNRLMANALLIKMAPTIERWVSEAQRGFLTNRFLLQNVVDVDFEAMKVSLRSSNGAIVLFDFEAAFPPLNHSFLWATLEHLGLPLPDGKSLPLLLQQQQTPEFHCQERHPTRMPAVPTSFRNCCGYSSVKAGKRIS